MWVFMLRRFLLPACVVSSTAVACDRAPSSCGAPSLCRASELPIYSGENCRAPRRDCVSGDRTDLEEAIGTARKELWVWVDEYKGYRKKVIDVVDEAQEAAKLALAYLKEESNYVPRVGAIGVSGLAGYVFAMRRGPVPRLLYAGVGSLAMASLCYPRYTALLTGELLSAAKKGFAIGYNFAYGVKPSAPGKKEEERRVVEAGGDQGVGNVAGGGVSGVEGGAAHLSSEELSKVDKSVMSWSGCDSPNPDHVCTAECYERCLDKGSECTGEGEED